MCKTTSFLPNKHICVNGKLLDISTPIVMGILNITSNSFYDGGYYDNDEKIISRVRVLLNEGADIIDIGAVSTKPGSTAIDTKDEINKIKHTLALIKTEIPHAIISVDTYRAEVADVALNNGAAMINDISGGQFDSEMFKTIAKHHVPYVLMHTQGTPDIMQEKPCYNNVIHELISYFSNKINTLNKMGINDIIIDPGFGFGKTQQQNFEILKNLNLFSIFELPILVGVSRKSMIWKTLNIDPTLALNGSSIINTIALMKGSKILRVHDVKEAKEAIKLSNLLS